MKKITSVIATLALVSSGISAFEWGGKIDNNTVFDGEKISDLELTQKNSISLWLNAPLNNSGTIYIAAEGSYGYEYDNEESDFTNIANLNLLKFAVKTDAGKDGTFALSAGRFGLGDASGVVFSQSCDGLMAGYSNPKLAVSVFGGYTGLLNAQKITILSEDDNSNELDDFYSLCDKYIPYGVMLKLPSLFANQNLNFQAWGFSDLNGDDFNRYYAEVGLNGYVDSVLSYNLVTTFGSKNFETLTNLSQLNLSIIPCDFASINFGGLYASGEQGKFSSFTAFTSNSSCCAMSDPEYSDMVKFNLGADFSIADYAIISADSAVVFDSSVDYKGFQWKVDANWFIFSDLKLGVTAYQFFAKDDSSEDSNIYGDKTSITINAAISF